MQLSNIWQGSRPGNWYKESKSLAAKASAIYMGNQSPKIKLSQLEYAYLILVQTYALWLAVTWKDKQTF